jgi:hypothetical protein
MLAQIDENIARITLKPRYLADAPGLYPRTERAKIAVFPRGTFVHS